MSHVLVRLLKRAVAVPPEVPVAVMKIILDEHGAALGKERQCQQESCYFCLEFHFRLLSSLFIKLDE
jgi:hypothetical protein